MFSVLGTKPTLSRAAERVRSWRQRLLAMQVTRFIPMRTTCILRAPRWTMAWLVVVCTAFLAGCSSLPQVDREAIASSAIGLSPQTTLGRIAQTSTPAADQSGFRLMPLGTFSYDTRVQ